MANLAKHLTTDNVNIPPSKLEYSIFSEELGSYITSGGDALHDIYDLKVVASILPYTDFKEDSGESELMTFSFSMDLETINSIKDDNNLILSKKYGVSQSEFFTYQQLPPDTFELIPLSSSYFKLYEEFTVKGLSLFDFYTFEWIDSQLIPASQFSTDDTMLKSFVTKIVADSTSIVTAELHTNCNSFYAKNDHEILDFMEFFVGIDNTYKWKMHQYVTHNYPDQVLELTDFNGLMDKPNGFLLFVNRFLLSCHLLSTIDVQVRNSFVNSYDIDGYNLQLLKLKNNKKDKRMMRKLDLENVSYEMIDAIITLDILTIQRLSVTNEDWLYS